MIYIAKQKLKAYFDPQKNRWYEVYRLRQTAQEPNETLDQFHTRLRTLSERCEFADLEFEFEQQIIVGGTSTKIRKRALRDPTFNLNSMLIKGRCDEQSTYQAKQIEPKEPSDGETKKLEQQSRASSGVTCKKLWTCLSARKGVASER